ncbi:MAG: GNAT family N-acetyltransferase [Magnetospirillum sp.]|nr:GNAT family N-acetyltransferase [Magnetospirillum sp.]
MTTTIRDIVATDIERVIELDRRLTGKPRRNYHEKRMAAASADPASFVTIAAADGPVLKGYAFAHILDGEFGGSGPVGVVDTIGVDPDQRGQGVGRKLMTALEEAMRKKGIKELISQADWTEHAITRFFQSAGFELAPRLVLERGTDNVSDFEAPLAQQVRDSDEVDLSDPSGDDYAALSRDRVPVRSLTEADYPFIVSVDRKVTRRDRSAYYTRKIAEVTKESGVRVSLVAEVDGLFAGFVMARTEYGEFGRAQSTAVLDTIGVDPANARHSVGRALMSQLLTNLSSLGVEKVQTQLPWNSFDLAGFLARCGFTPSQRLIFQRKLG